LFMHGFTNVYSRDYKYCSAAFQSFLLALLRLHILAFHG
jgi:hypothetical protein